MLPGHPPDLLDETGLSPPSKTSLSLSKEIPRLCAGQLGAHPLCDSLAGAKCLREMLGISSPGRSRGGLCCPRSRLAAFTPLAAPSSPQLTQPLSLQGARSRLDHARGLEPPPPTGDPAPAGSSNSQVMGGEAAQSRLQPGLPSCPERRRSGRSSSDAA